jgi:hypothetical protein
MADRRLVDMALKNTYVKCSFPNCTTTVGQHSKIKNTNKQVCEAHRKSRKHEVDKWKLNNGCNNKDGHYGFPCVCSTILDSATIDINHIDGDNLNRTESNIETLCKMCHTVVTIRNGHHTKKPKRSLKPIIDDALFC